MDLKYWLAGNHLTFFFPSWSHTNLECRPQQLNNPPTRSKIQISHVEFKVLHDPPAYHFTAFSNSKTFRPLWGIFWYLQTHLVFLCGSVVLPHTYELTNVCHLRGGLFWQKGAILSTPHVILLPPLFLLLSFSPRMWAKTLSILVNSIPLLLEHCLSYTVVQQILIVWMHEGCSLQQVWKFDPSRGYRNWT